MLEVDINKKGNAAQFDMTGFEPAAMYQEMMLDGEQGSYRWEDGDTVYDDITGQGYRINGMNALETDHMALEDQAYKAGEYGGELQKKKFYELAKKLGYNNLVKTGEKDKYNRYITDLQNDIGESFSTSLYANDLITPDRWTSDKDRNAWESKHFNSLMGIDTTQSSWGQAKIELDAHMQNGTLLNKFGSPFLKKAAMNEWELKDAQINSEIYGVMNPFLDDQVKYRHEGMDMTGNATNVWSASIAQGWASMSEATSGALSMLGSLTGNQGWYEKGQLDALAKSNAMMRMPKFVQNWDDVEFGENAADYLIGLGGVSIPWMLGIIGSGVAGTLAVGAGATGIAAVVGGAIGITPMAMVYAGEIFNSMEGDINTKDPKIALTGGIAMTVLDRLGLKGIMKPSEIMKRDGYKQLKAQFTKKKIDEIEADPGYFKLSKAEQIAMKAKALRQVDAEMAAAKVGAVTDVVKAMAGHADIQVKKHLLLKEFGQGFVKGGLWESGTEAIQESTSYLASIAGSEREFNWNEFNDIAKNAAIGGFLMGSTISGTMGTAGGYGSVKKMQSDYGMAAYDAADGFFNYAENENGEALGNAVASSGNVYPVRLTEQAFKYTAESIFNYKRTGKESDLVERTDMVGNTWEPAFVDVEEINQEILNESKGSDVDLQRQVDEQVKLGEGKGIENEDGVVVGKLSMWDKAKRLPKQAFMKYGSIVAKALKDPDLSNKSKRHLSALLQTFAGTNIGMAVGVGFQKIKGRLTEGYVNEASNLREALLNTVGQKKTAGGITSATKTFKSFVDSKRALERGEKTAKEHKEQWGDMMSRLDQIHNRMTRLTDALLDTVNNNVDDLIGPDGKKIQIGKVEDWFFNSAKLDTSKILKGKGRFISSLQRDWVDPQGNARKGLSAKDAEALYNRLVFDAKGQMELTHDDIYKNTTAAGAANERTLNVNDNPLMQEFLHTDHFGKLENNIHDMINYAMDIKYLGRNDSKLNAMIMAVKDRMSAEGKWDANIAAVVKNSVDTQRGRYKAIKNQKLKKVQDNITFFNTLTQLDTSMLASLPELALVMLGAAYNKGLINVVRQGASDVIKHYATNSKQTKQYFKGQNLTNPDLKDVGPTPTIINQFDGKKHNKAKDITIEDINMNRLSFYGGQYGTSHHGVLGAVDIDSSAYETNKWKTWVLESFFRMNGLKFLTDGSRIARLAIANDAIFNDLEIVQGFYEVGKLNSNLANDAFERLRELNIDPVKAARQFEKVNKEVSQLNQAGTKGFISEDGGKLDTKVLHEYIFKNHTDLYNTLEDARISFVDNALARPTSVDRPLWYSNPHFRLLTQYQGFLSTFTSHIIPKLYKRAKKADPTLKYQAFAVAATMFALAILGQEAKDEWKFGKHSPYVDTNMKNAQRALSASGLLGTGHRLLDYVHPIYTSGPRYNDTTLDQMGRFFSHTLDEFGGPSGGTIKNTNKMVGALIEGNGAQFMYYGKNFIPLVGRHMKGDKPVAQFY